MKRADPNPLLSRHVAKTPTAAARALNTPKADAAQERELAGRLEDEEDTMKFEDAVSKIAARDRVTKSQAMRMARVRFPNLYDDISAADAPRGCLS